MKCEHEYSDWSYATVTERVRICLECGELDIEPIEPDDYIDTAFKDWYRCPTCDGIGEIMSIHRTCSTCNGFGLVSPEHAEDLADTGLDNHAE